MGNVPSFTPPLATGSSTDSVSESSQSHTPPPGGTVDEPSKIPISEVAPRPEPPVSGVVPDPKPPVNEVAPKDEVKCLCSELVLYVAVSLVGCQVVKTFASFVL